MAVVRVKRHLTEEPSEALLFQYKRRKVEKNEEITYDLEQSTVLRFAGTLNNQSEDVSHLMTKPAKDQLEANFKKPNLDLVAKLRARKQLEIKNSRYKIVNCFRSKHVMPEKQESEEITVYDVETAVDRPLESNETPGSSKHELAKDSTEQNCSSNSNEASSVSKTEQDYVYDVYYTDSTNFTAETDLEQQYISLYQMDDPLDWGALEDNGMDSHYDNNEYDSEDSNAENNYRNDYPEEEDSNKEDDDEEEDRRSIDEGDMIAAFQKVHLEGTDCGLSSDSDQDLYDEDDPNDLNYFDESDEEHLKFAKAFRKFIKSKGAPEPDSDGVDEDLHEED